MDEQSQITFEQKVVDNLGKRIGVLTADLEITAVQRDMLQQELDKAKRRIAELESNQEQQNQEDINTNE